MGSHYEEKKNRVQEKVEKPVDVEAVLRDVGAQPF